MGCSSHRALPGIDVEHPGFGPDPVSPVTSATPGSSSLPSTAGRSAPTQLAPARGAFAFIATAVRVLAEANCIHPVDDKERPDRE